MESFNIKSPLQIALFLSFVNPLELVKTRIQTMNELRDIGKIPETYKGVSDCFKKITQKEGIRALWKGNAIGLIRFFPNEQINYNVKSFSQKFLNKNYASNAVAGITGGWTSALILYPIDQIRLHLNNSIGKN
jgi:solute carrier family 25 (adenine nucleotide translocator) protein 4/5/6/31